MPKKPFAQKRWIDGFDLRWSFSTLALLILATELFLALGRGTYWVDPRHSETPSAALLRDRIAVLEKISQGKKKLLVLGDSVFYGSALREKGLADWKDETPPGWMRKALADKGWDILDFSADGLYPADLAGLDQACQALRPDAVVMELNVRMFAPEAGDAAGAMTRPWLSRFGSGGRKLSLADRLSAGAEGLSRLYRYSLLARDKIWGGGAENFFAGFWDRVLGRIQGDLDPELLLDFKIRPAYSAPPMGASHLGYQALHNLARSLGESGRPVLVFLTPQNWPRVQDFLEKEPLAANRKAAEQVFQGQGGVRYRDWADRGARGGAFLDHCHMDGQANKALAEDILRELGL